VRDLLALAERLNAAAPSDSRRAKPINSSGAKPAIVIEWRRIVGNGTGGSDDAIEASASVVIQIVDVRGSQHWDGRKQPYVSAGPSKRRDTKSITTGPFLNGSDIGLAGMVRLEFLCPITHRSFGFRGTNNENSNYSRHIFGGTCIECRVMRKIALTAG